MPMPLSSITEVDESSPKSAESMSTLFDDEPALAPAGASETESSADDLPTIADIIKAHCERGDSHSSRSQISPKLQESSLGHNLGRSDYKINESEWEIKGILDERDSKSGREYKVRWEDSWVPEASLENASQALKAFKARRKRRRQWIEREGGRVWTVEEIKEPHSLGKRRWACFME